MSMPDSGFFLEYEGSGKYITAMEWLWIWQNTSDAMNVNCMKAHENTNDQSKCMFAQETAKFVDVKMMPLQSRFDSWQAGCELQSKDDNLINAYGANLTDNFENLYINSNKQIHSAFLDSCKCLCLYVGVCCILIKFVCKRLSSLW